MRHRIDPVDSYKQLLVAQRKFEIRIPYSSVNSGRVTKGNFVFVGQPCDRAIKGSAIDVREAQPPCQTARDRALSRCSRPVNRNNRKLWIGFQSRSKMSAGLITGVDEFSSGVRKLCNCSSKPG